MITIKPMTPEDFEKMTGIKEIDEKNRPKETPKTTADIVVIAINDALREAKYRGENLGLFTKSDGDNLIVTINKNDNETHLLCKDNPTESDFNEVIDRYYYLEWTRKLVKQKNMDGMIYAFLMF